MTGRWRRVAAALALVAGLLPAARGEASSRYDPRLRFRTLSTARFDIHFHQGEEADARRLAVLAEDVATSLVATLGPATGRIQVVLVNQDDLPNGWATPLPYNLIEIRTVTPGGALSIGHTDDWLRLVFTHEYTHAVHLSRGKSWIGGLRHVFGRHPLLFPNLTLPAWQIEGIAVYEESSMTGSGRLFAGDFRAIVDTAAASGRFEPLDRVSGGLDDWPRGHGPYVYGGYFHQYLAARFGPAALRALTDRTAALPPYFGSLAFPSVFGQPLGELWRAYAEDVAAKAGRDGPAATRLTAHGFTVGRPQVGPDGAVYYSVAGPDGFPDIRRLVPGQAGSTHVVDRYLGEMMAFAGHTLVFDQADIHAQVGLQFDLYAYDTGTRRTVRLTAGARAADPDLLPDGSIVCTVQRTDRRDLVVYPFDAATSSVGTPQVLASGAGVAFTAPRVSPDGRWIAVERRRSGRMPEVVIVEGATREVRVVAAATDRRFTTPSWAPDGRRLFMAADLGGPRVGLVVADIASGDLRQLADAGDVARSPVPAPDGRTVMYVGTTDAGDDLFSLPVDDARWTSLARPPAGTPPGAEAPPGAAEAPAGAAEAPAYSPWRMLAPRFWTPTVEADAGETVVGAATGAGDPLGRHVFAAEAGWAAARARPDWQVAYAYDRWWPTLFASYSDDTDPLDVGAIRTREATAGLLLPIRAVRLTQSLLAAAYYGDEQVERAGADGTTPDVRRRRGALRLGYSWNSSRLYGYSISPADGSSATISTELTREALGGDGNAGSLVVDLRHYQSAWPRHGVVAIRAAAAGSSGDDTVRRRFSASGDAAQPGGFRFGVDAIDLVRGFDTGDARPHAAVLNVDYRFPLWRIQRGLGAWPFFARTLHGAVFADVGHAWDSHPRLADARRSVGVELSLDTVLGHGLPLTLSAGAAWRTHGTGVSDGAVFARVGRAF